MSDYLQRLVLRGAGGLSAARAPAAPVAPSALIEEISQEAPGGPMTAPAAASPDVGQPRGAEVARAPPAAEPVPAPRVA
ncbi:MAG: hypothetical protein ACREE0_01300, partial [Phenylobacterium sp.]